VTRLIGGLVVNGEEIKTHMYDVRDTRRFYDTDGNGNGLIETSDDYVSIDNPTTSNIITWANKDKWGRTPYCFQDFVFCKYWNIIPNNRLITFRKYAAPTYDNLNFPNMFKAPQEGETLTFAPVATVVSYFGGDSPNKLSDLIKFTTGTKWKDLKADMHQVTGDTGDNPRAVIDRMFESTNGGGLASGSQIVDKLLNKTGGLTGMYFSFGKFTGLLRGDGYNGHSQDAYMRLTQANVDPTDQIYSNRIYGPVNRVMETKARD